MKSIRTRVMLALVVAGLVPVILMLVATHTSTRKAIILSERDKLSELGDEVSRQILRIIDDATDDLASMAKSRVLMNPDRSESSLEAKRVEFRRLTSSYAHLREISLHDTLGYYIESDSDDATGKLDETREFSDAVESKHGTPIYSPPLWESRLTKDGDFESYMHMTVHLPIAETEGGIPHSVVRASVNFESFWEILDHVRVGETGRFVLLDPAGNMLSHPDKERVLEKFDSEISPEFWKSNMSGEFHSSLEGRRYIFETKLLPKKKTGVPQDWYLLCYQSTEEVSAIVRQHRKQQLIVGAVTLLVASLVGFMLARQMSISVKRASVAAQEVTRGDLETIIPESGFSEMRGLASSFNQMVHEVKDHRTRLESLVETRTERLRESQADLEDLTAQLRATYESTREAVLVVRPNGNVLAANRLFEQFFNINVGNLLKEGLGARSESKRALVDCFNEDQEFQATWKKFTDNPDLVGEAEWEVKGATEMCLSVYSAPVKNSHGKTFARLWMFRDMTEQRRLKFGLQQAQKMEAIGRLSGGVAHDFNNLLTGIIGSLSLNELQRDENPEEAKQLVTAAKRAAERAAGIVKQLLTFSRQNKLTVKRCSANELVRETQDILTPGLDPSIQLISRLDETDPYMMADGNQVDQVLMNFCVNARDALVGGGTIVVETSHVTLKRDELPHQENCEPGEYVVISVKDNGTGIPETVRENIFEPFFTTKEQGKGTGLGLATSYGIVQQHSGWIECDSEIDVGTTFTVYIPACARPEDDAEAGPKEPKGGSETILVVDDEMIVRRVAVGVLERHGYTVKTAQDGKEALEIVAECADSISLILLDLTMPRLSGRDTFRALRSGRFPHIPVIICSGYLVELDSFEEEAGSVPEGAVQKPYEVGLLAAGVRQVIDAHCSVNSEPSGGSSKS